MASFSLSEQSTYKKIALLEWNPLILTQSTTGEIKFK